MAGKRIGYFDYHLDNFHANHYLKLLRGPLADRGYTVSACRGMQDEPSRAWAKANDVPYAESVEALADACDYLMILAPSNPEVHLEMAEQALRFGKTTYIDKTFAPDLATARKIFALADAGKAPVITSSALRFTDEMRAVDRASIRQLQVWGGGGNFPEYAIHPVEVAVSTLGPGVTHAMRAGGDAYGQIHLRYPDGLLANVFVDIGTPCGFQAVVATDKEVRYTPLASDFFLNLLTHILGFFEAGAPTIDRRETLAIRWILDVAAAGPGDWVPAPAF